jgi:hypothetical protein
MRHPDLEFSVFRPRLPLQRAEVEFHRGTVGRPDELEQSPRERPRPTQDGRLARRHRANRWTTAWRSRWSSHGGPLVTCSSFVRSLLGMTAATP